MNKISPGLQNLIFVFCIFVITSTAVAENMLSKDNDTKIEKKIGDCETAVFIQNVVLINAPEIESKIQNMAEKIVATTGHNSQVRVHIVNQPIIRAFSLPSGDIFIFSGLLDRLENIDQLAFILGHEIAHIVHHDGINNLKGSMGRQQTTENVLTIITPVIAGGTSGLLSGIVPVPTMTDSTSTLFSKELAQRTANSLGGLIGVHLPIMMAENVLLSMTGSYSQKAELRADKSGVEYAKRAGYNAKRGAEKVFVILREEEERIKNEQLKK